MQAERFRSLLTARGPFASVYFDDSHDTADAETQIDLKWRGLRRELQEHEADPKLIDTIGEAIADTRPAVGRSGRGVVATAAGVLLDEHLIRPVGPAVRVSSLPYLVPVVEHGVDHSPYLVVAVDHTGGDIGFHRDGTVVSDTVDGKSYPVHKAAGAESSGYGDPQPRVEEDVHKNVRAVAERLASIVDDVGPEVVFVVGDASIRNDLVHELPERVRSRVVPLTVGARHTGLDDEELRHAIEEQFQLRRVAAIDDAAQSFRAAIGSESGLATEGLAGVTAALRAGAVETLIIGDVDDATVVAGDDLAVVAPNPNVLSEWGVASTRVLRADEALPMAAIAIDAALVRTDERIDPADGIGAVLRYRLP